MPTWWYSSSTSTSTSTSYWTSIVYWVSNDGNSWEEYEEEPKPKPERKLGFFNE